MLKAVARGFLTGAPVFMADLVKHGMSKDDDGCRPGDDPIPLVVAALACPVVMIKRACRGHWYCGARGEIL